MIFEELPQFVLVSEQILQRPVDWPDNVHQVGYWTRPVKVRLSQSLTSGIHSSRSVGNLSREWRLASLHWLWLNAID